MPTYMNQALNPKEVESYIRQAAISRRIDPTIALRVWGSEGRGGYVGDNGSSFGPLQLHYGGVAPGGNRVPGLGDEFTKKTGLDARDPSTWKQQIDFSLDHAAKSGWGPWHGAAKVGLSNNAGIPALVGAPAPQPDGIESAPPPMSEAMAPTQSNGFEGMNSFGNALLGVGGALQNINNPGAGNSLIKMAMENMQTPKMQFRGFMPNGKGMVFTDARGNEQIRPVPEAYQGPKESNLPAEVVAAQYFKEHPDDLKVLRAMRGQEGPIGEDGQYKYQFPVEDLDKAIERMSAGEKLTMNDKQFKRDLNHRMTEKGIDPIDFAAGAAAQTGRMAEFRRYADITSRIDSLVPGFQADISAARKAIDDYKKIAGDGNIVPLNRLLAAGTEAFSGPGAAALARARETLKTTIDRFAAIQGQGRLTEASRKEALQLLSPYMQQGVSGSVLDSMETMALRTRDNNRKTRANMEARMRNKDLPYPELEGSPESTPSPATPQNDKSTQSMPEGARQAPDGNWYVEKDGKFYRVKQPK